MDYFIHKSSDVHTKNIGEDTVIWQFNVILEGVVIGKNCNINSHCFIEGGAIIGNNVTIKCGVYLWNGIILEDNVFIGPNVSFANDKYPRSKKYPKRFSQTVVKKGASIGAGASILSGLTIDEYSMIGAGSVITKNTHPFSLWYGNPAKHCGYVTKSGEILNLNMVSKTGVKHQLVNNNLIPL